MKKQGKTNKILSFCIIISMLFAMVTVPASAGFELPCGGDCGENATWVLDENYTLTISGTGMVESAYFYDYEIHSIVVEEGITGIGDDAFAWCGMESISLPESLVSIGAYSFLLCENLSSIEIPANVSSIGESAFRACSKLSDFEVASENQFYCAEEGVLFNKDKTYLICYPPYYSRDVYLLPDSVEEIAGDAFNRCFILTDIETNANSCFSSVDGVLFNADKTVLVRYAAGRKSRQYSIANSVTRIEEFAFYDCSKLEYLSFGTQLTEVGARAFYDCDKLSVFYGGTSEQWKNITIEGGNDVLVNAVVVYENQTIPDLSNLIATGTCGASLIWTLDFDGTLTISGTGEMDRYAKITETIMDEWGRPSYTIEYYQYPWWDHVSMIKTVVVKEGVTRIGNMAFAEIKTLTTAYLPVSLLGVVNAAFYKTGLTDVYYAGTQEQWSNVGKGPSNTPLENAAMHYNYPVPEDINDTDDLEIPEINGEWGENVNWSLKDGVLTISGTGAMPDGAYHGDTPWIEQKLSIKKIIVCDDITSVGDYAFWDCLNLTEVSLGKGIKSIGKHAFLYCEKLTAISFPEGLESIGSAAFAQNAALTTVYMPSTLTYIDDCAFGGCENLTDVYYNGKETQWNNINIVSRDDSEDHLCQATIHYNDCEHSSMTHHAAVPHTCTEDGTIEYWECDVCGRRFSDEAGEDQISSIVDPAGHRYVDEMIFAPTCCEEGTVKYTCTECGNTYTDVVPATEEHNFVDGSCTNLRRDGETVCGAPDVIASGYCGENGENLEWSIRRSDGVLTISGTGRTATWTVIYVTPMIGGVPIGTRASRVFTPWSDYKDQIKKIDIKEGVTGLSNYSFFYISNATEVVIPKSMRAIGHSSEANVFMGCSSLKDIYYAGTEAEWEDINYTGTLNVLNNSGVTVHYEYDPDAPPAPVDFDVSIVGKVCKVTPQNANNGDSVIFTALKDGVLTKLRTEKYSGDPLEFEIPDDYDSVKVMIWDSLSGMRPLAPAKSK